MNQAQKDTLLRQQEAGWAAAVEAGRKGNPFATLCLRCYGRHKPPHDEICPYDPPDSKPKISQDREAAK